MSHAFQSALAAVSQIKHDLIGKLVRHPDSPGEWFFVEAFEGEYRTSEGDLYEFVRVRPVEKHAEQTFPARADRLIPEPIN